MTTALLFLLQTTTTAGYHAGTGREWMVVAAILVPFVVLAVVVFLGTRRTVDSSIKNHD